MTMLKKNLGNIMAKNPINQTAFVHGVELSSGSVDMGRIDKKLTVE